MAGLNGARAKGAFVVNLELGKIVETKGVAEDASSDHLFGTFVNRCLVKHRLGDWGDISEEDKLSNDEAAKGEDRIVSSYNIPTMFISAKRPEKKLWIITEWDRSVTTILYPSEY